MPTGFPVCLTQDSESQIMGNLAILLPPNQDFARDCSLHPNMSQWQKSPRIKIATLATYMFFFNNHNVTNINCFVIIS